MTQLCNPIDGNWEILDWETCQPSCTRTRNKTCTNPVPVFGGQSCEGPNQDSEFCLSGHCNQSECYEHAVYLNNNIKTIDGISTPQDCQDLCKKNADCIGFHVSNSEDICKLKSKLNSKQKSYIGNTNVISGPKNCPIHGNWTELDNFLPCINGLERGFRTCTNPKPEFGGEECIGNTYILRNCTEDEGNIFDREQELRKQT